MFYCRWTKEVQQYRDKPPWIIDIIYLDLDFVGRKEEVLVYLYVPGHVSSLLERSFFFFNPAYGRHWISLLVWLVEPIQFYRDFFMERCIFFFPLKNYIFCWEVRDVSNFWSFYKFFIKLNSVFVVVFPIRFLFAQEKKSAKTIKLKKKKTKIVSLHRNIRRICLGQKSPQPPEEVVFNCHRQTHRQTDGHCVW